MKLSNEIERGGIYLWNDIPYIDRSWGMLFDKCGARSGSSQLYTNVHGIGNKSNNYPFTRTLHIKRDNGSILVIVPRLAIAVKQVPVEFFF